MDDGQSRDVVRVFLSGARVVADAIGDPAVESAWDLPSVLAEQKVSGLAGHLARGAVWAVGDYLDGAEPDSPIDFASAGAYFAGLLREADDAAHRAIRDRGAAVAAVGRTQLLDTLAQRIDMLEARLPGLAPGRLVAVASGKVMRLGDYLITRVVEQAVHLDDLARSVGRDPWPMGDAAEALTIATGADIGRHRFGAAPMIRALYRSGFAEAVLPVL